MSYRMVYRRIAIVVTEILTISIEPFYPKETLNAEVHVAQPEQPQPGAPHSTDPTAAGDREPDAGPPVYVETP